VKSRIFFPHNKLNPTVFFPAFRRIVIGQWLQTTHPHGIESLFVNISFDNFCPDRKCAKALVEGGAARLEQVPHLGSLLG
jgi:hypothetical protein